MQAFWGSAELKVWAFTPEYPLKNWSPEDSQGHAMPCTYQNAKKKEARSARPPTGDWRGFPGGSDGEESACNAGDPSSIPGLGRSPGEENGKGTGYTHCDDKPSTAAVKVGAKKDNVMTRKCFQRVKKKKKKKTEQWRQRAPLGPAYRGIWRGLTPRLVGDTGVLLGAPDTGPLCRQAAGATERQGPPLSCLAPHPCAQQRGPGTQSPAQ